MSQQAAYVSGNASLVGPTQHSDIMHVLAPVARDRPVRRPMHQVISSNGLYEGSDEIDLLVRVVNGLGTPEIQRESQSVEAYLRALDVVNI